MDYRTALRNARSGAKFLDSQPQPVDWRSVDPDTLDMSNYQYCLLGKVFGSYNTGRCVLGLSVNLALSYGFEVDPYGSNRLADYERLNRAWKTLLPDKLRDEYLAACDEEDEDE